MKWRHDADNDVGRSSWRMGQVRKTFLLAYEKLAASTLNDASLRPPLGFDDSKM